MIPPYYIALAPGEFAWRQAAMADHLLRSTPVHTGEWQAQDTSQNKYAAMYEVCDATLHLCRLFDENELREVIKPNLPWADEHFAERVGGVPLNPPPSHKLWPWARYNKNHQTDTGEFSHTYPERMWPKWAHLTPGYDNIRSVDAKRFARKTGLRFAYGDLSDVVNLLVRSPLTRQAYLPIWFPEDTGAVEGQRVPCTLGYHFMIREGVMSLRYYIRSCDIIRHFADDVYLAERLLHWMCDQVNQSGPATYVTPGHLTMHIASLHAFVGDKTKLEVMAHGPHDA